jgi:pimeloyl-ACP methyl ester carboxylesterase
VAPLDLEEFTYAFVNTWPDDAARDAYERYCVPETGRIFFEAGTANLRLHAPTEVDYHRAGRAPMLLVGAEKDHTVPAAVVRSQHKKYAGGASPVEYVEFAGRPHLFMTGDGWEEVATHIDAWLTRNAA